MRSVGVAAAVGGVKACSGCRPGAAGGRVKKLSFNVKMIGSQQLAAKPPPSVVGPCRLASYAFDCEETGCDGGASPNTRAVMNMQSAVQE